MKAEKDCSTRKNMRIVAALLIIINNLYIYKSVRYFFLNLGRRGRKLIGIGVGGGVGENWKGKE
jgi:hypothetical protein